MQKMHAESLITSKINTHYGSPPTSRYNHGPYQQKHPYKSPPFHPEVNHSNSHTKKYSIMAKITFLFRFFILFLKEPRVLLPLSSSSRLLQVLAQTMSGKCVVNKS